MIRRRAAAAGIAAMLGNHGLRATGITAYPKNGGTLEKAAQMASHATTRTIKLYDRRRPSVPMKVRHQPARALAAGATERSPCHVSYGSDAARRRASSRSRQKTARCASSSAI